MRFCVISSGSKANCTYIEAGDTRILIDCGLSAKQTELRLLERGLAPDKIDAIIVTHEHSDHIHGIPTFSKRYRIPVYSNEGTSRHLKNPFAIERFSTGDEFWIGGLRISPFSIVHDAEDPVGFVIRAEGLKFTQATDLGRVTPLVLESIRESNAIVLESNHDQELLENCSYPWELKQRISSSHGHLSNDTATSLLHDIVHPALLHVVLGHLSENSNTPERALETVVQRFSSKVPFSLRCGSVRAASSIIEVDELPEVSHHSFMEAV